MPLLLLVALLAAACTIALAVVTRTGHIQHWDDGLESWAIPRRALWLRVASIVTLPGEWYAHYSLGAIVAAFLLGTHRGPWQAVVLPLIAASVGATLAHHLVKFVYRRARPEGALRRNKTEPAFPSGHTTNITSVLGTGCFMLVHFGVVPAPAAIVFLVVVCGCVGVSRVALGWHWSSDVVGGWLTGLSVASLCAALFLSLA